jgi:predicted nucleic acid-binding protein
MNAVLLDAGPMVTIFRPEEAAHAHYKSLLLQERPQYQLHTTWPCICEAVHLLKGMDRLALMRWIGHGAVQVFPFDAADMLDMTPWMQRYSEPPRSVMDLADASLYWLACESGVRQVMTLDVRDFSRYRLPGGEGFEIL